MQNYAGFIMKKVNFIFVLAVATILFGLVKAEATDSDFYQGFDAFIEEASERQGKKDPSFYFPSERFTLFQQLSNIRFFADQGRWKPEIPVQFQSIHVQNVRNDKFPQTFIGALIQILFPSPDGFNLIPNQAVTDPISELSLDKISLVLKAVKQYEDTDSNKKDQNLLKRDLLKLIGCKFETTHGQMVGFQIHDFKIKLYQNALEEIKFYEEDFEKKGIKAEEEGFVSHCIDAFMPDIFDKGFFENSEEVEKYARLAIGIRRFKELSNFKPPSYLGNNPKRTDLQEIEFVQFKEEYEEIVLFEEQRKSFYRYQFVDALVGALGKKNPKKYPEFLVQRALLTFFWKKVTNSKDVAAFFSTLFECDPEKTINILNNKRPTFEDYTKFRQNMGSETTLEELLKNPEFLIFLSRGYDIFENPLPPMIQYRTAGYKGKFYPDCVETSLRIIALLAARKKTKAGYIIDPLVFPEQSFLRDYFSQFLPPESHFTQEAHDCWSDGVSQKAGILYLKPPGNQEKIYEIRPGLLNAVKVLGHLFPNMKEVENIAFEEGREGLIKAFNLLLPNLSSPDMTITCDGLEWVDLSPKKKDFFDEIRLVRNGQKILVWKMTEGHSVISPLENFDQDWRKQMPFDLEKNQGSIEKLTPFILPKNMVSILEGLSPDKQASMIYAIDMNSLETKTALMSFIFKNKIIDLFSLGLNLLKYVTSLADAHASQRVRATLNDCIIPLFQGDEPQIDHETIKTILTECPYLFGNGDGFSDYCFKMKKYDWIELAAPQTHSLSLGCSHFSFNIGNEGIEGQFLNYLPLFKRIASLNIGGLPKLMSTPHDELFLKTVQSLKRLNSISISFNLDIKDCFRLIDYVPKKIWHLSLNLGDTLDKSAKGEEEMVSVMSHFSQKLPNAELHISVQPFLSESQKDSLTLAALPFLIKPSFPYEGNITLNSTG